jgi:phytanoyl-CoA hydroxylase
MVSDKREVKMTFVSDYLTTGENISDEQIQAFHKQGFVYLPGVISKSEAQRFHSAALEASNYIESFSKGKAEKVFTQLVNVWREDPVLKELTFHPNLAAIAERLAGVALRLWHDQILIKQPHNSAATEFHQDQPYWPHNNSDSRHCLSAWVALCDVPVERGCMTFIEESHHYTGLRPQDLMDATDLLQLCPDLVYMPRTTVPLKAGDCTFHNSWTAHMATPNFTDTARVAQIIIYMDADTTYSGKPHPVTDSLHLKVGEALSGEMFPQIKH